MSEVLFPVKDAARRLGISIWTLRKKAYKSDVASVKIGVKLLIPESEVDRLIHEGMRQRRPGGGQAGEAPLNPMAANLRRSRIALGVSRSKLAHLSGVRRSKICRFELGDGPPTDVEQVHIREALQAEVERLLQVSRSLTSSGLGDPHD